MQPPFPFTLGAEFSGKISQSSPIPKGCPYKAGDRVFGSIQGAYADRIAVPWKVLVPLSHKITFDQGAGNFFTIFLVYIIHAPSFTGLFLTYPTSYEALVGRAELKSGSLPKLIYNTLLIFS